MSKYKVGDKFVIEIGHGTVDPLYGARYFIKGFNTLVFDDYGLESLEQVSDSPTLREAYDRGYEKGLKEGRNEKDCKACMDADAKANADYNSGYEDGLRDAWECAKIIANFNVGENYARFGVSFTAEVLNEYSASEAENRIVEYEAKQNKSKYGTWVFVGDNMYKCDKCGELYTTEQFETLRNKTTDPYAPKFCPACGARKGTDDETD